MTSDIGIVDDGSRVDQERHKELREYWARMHGIDLDDPNLDGSDQRLMDIFDKRYGPVKYVNCVIQDWALRLPLKMQSVLCLGLRGCDGRNKEDPSKVLLRQLRQTVFNPANPNYMNDTNDNFMKSGKDIGAAAEQFLGDLDPYPMHWLMHFLHACEIVGYKHPDPTVSHWWLKLYNRAVWEGLHLETESEARLDKRLG